MYVVGVGLKKVYKVLIKLAGVGGGVLHPPSDVYVRSFSLHFPTFIKLCYTKALE